MFDISTLYHFIAPVILFGLLYSVGYKFDFERHTLTLYGIIFLICAGAILGSTTIYLSVAMILFMLARFRSLNMFEVQ